MAHLTNVSFELFYEIFTEDASQCLLLPWPKNWDTHAPAGTGARSLEQFASVPVSIFLARVVYTMVQKSQKWPKTQIKGGVLPKGRTPLTWVFGHFWLFCKKKKIWGKVPFSDMFASPKVITTAHAHKSGVIFHFFLRAFKQKKIKAPPPKMTKIASRGPALKPSSTVIKFFLAVTKTQT